MDIEDIKIRIESFSTLENNWDSYGAAKITPQSIITAINISDSIFKTNDKNPINVFPMRNGGIQFEIGNCKEIEIFNCEIKEMLFDDDYNIIKEINYVWASKEDSVEFIKEYEECVKTPDKFSDEQLQKLISSKSDERWNSIKLIIEARKQKIIDEWNNKYPQVPYGSIELELGKNYSAHMDGNMLIKTIHGKLWAFPPTCGEIYEE